MKPIHKILHHAIVVPFYKQIAGVIYLLFFILFGIQPNFKQAINTHYYIILSILFNNQAFIIYAMLCFLYCIKCVLFYNNRIKKPEYLFLQRLNGISRYKKLSSLIFLSVILLTPLIVYSIFIVGIAISESRGLAMLPPAILIMSIITIMAFAFSYLTSSPLWSLAGQANLQFKQPSKIWWFVIKYILNEQFWSFFLLKMISFCCIYYMVVLDASIFENRILWMVFLLCLCGHCVIIYKNFYFIENKLSLYRNLPLKSSSILLSLVLLYAVILIPEFWALRALIVVHHLIGEYGCMIFLAPALLTLLHVLLYTDDFNMDSYLSIVFLVWIVLFFSSFTQHKWFLPIAVSCGYCIVFYTSFRNYEKKPNVEKLE